MSLPSDGAAMQAAGLTEERLEEIVAEQVSEQIRHTVLPVLAEIDRKVTEDHAEYDELQDDFRLFENQMNAMLGDLAEIHGDVTENEGYKLSLKEKRVATAEGIKQRFSEVDDSVNIMEDRIRRLKTSTSSEAGDMSKTAFARHIARYMAIKNADGDKLAGGSAERARVIEFAEDLGAEISPSSATRGIKRLEKRWDAFEWKSGEHGANTPNARIQITADDIPEECRALNDEYGPTEFAEIAEQM